VCGRAASDDVWLRATAWRSMPPCGRTLLTFSLNMLQWIKRTEIDFEVHEFGQKTCCCGPFLYSDAAQSFMLLIVSIVFSSSTKSVNCFAHGASDW